MLTQPGFIMLKITGKRGQPWTFGPVGNWIYSLWCRLSEGNDLFRIVFSEYQESDNFKRNVLLATTSCLQAFFCAKDEYFYLSSDFESLLNLTLPPCLELQITYFRWDLMDTMDTTEEKWSLVTFGSLYSSFIYTFIIRRNVHGGLLGTARICL